VPPVYDSSGAALASTTHAVIGSGTGTGTAQTITLSGAAVFTSSASYSVAVSHANGGASSTDVALVSGSSFTINAPNTVDYNWIAIGS
jgi:hypothetical protein